MLIVSGGCLECLRFVCWGWIELSWFQSPFFIQSFYRTFACWITCSLWNDIGWMRPWLRLLRRESATKVHPVASSALPISITALSKVCPWLLCIVMAYRIWRGSCWRESCQSLDSHSNVSGGTSTQFGLQLRNGGPAEWSKSTSTAIGKCGGLWSVGTATGELYQQNHYKDKVAAKCWQSTWSPSGLLWSTLK